MANSKQRTIKKSQSKGESAQGSGLFKRILNLCLGLVALLLLMIPVLARIFVQYRFHFSETLETGLVVTTAIASVSFFVWFGLYLGLGKIDRSVMDKLVDIFIDFLMTAIAGAYFHWMLQMIAVVPMLVHSSEPLEERPYVIVHLTHDGRAKAPCDNNVIIVSEVGPGPLHVCVYDWVFKRLREGDTVHIQGHFNSIITYTKAIRFNESGTGQPVKLSEPVPLH